MSDRLSGGIGRTTVSSRYGTSTTTTTNSTTSRGVSRTTRGEPVRTTRTVTSSSTNSAAPPSGNDATATSDFSQERAALQAQIDSANARIAELEEDLNEALTSRRDLKTKFKQRKQLCKELETRVAALIEENEALRNDRGEDAVRGNEKVVDILVRVEAERDTLLQRIKELEAANPRSTPYMVDEKPKRQGDFTSFQSSPSDEKNANSSQGCKSCEEATEHKQHLLKQIDALRLQLSNQTSSTDKEDTRAQLLTERLNESQRLLLSAQEKLGELRADARRHTAQIEQYERRVAGLTHELQQLRLQPVPSADSETQSLLSDRAERIKTLEEQVATHFQEKAKSAQEFARMQAELASAKEAMGDDYNDKLALERSREERNRLQIQLDDARNTNRMLAADLQRARALPVSDNAGVGSAPSPEDTGQIRQLSQHNGDLRLQNGVLAQDNEVLKRRLSDLKKSYDKLKLLASESAGLADETQNSLSAKSEALSRRSQEIHKLRERLFEREAEVGRLEKALELADGQRAQLSSQDELIAEDNRVLREKCKALNTELVRAQASSTRADALDTQLAQSETQRLALEQQLADLRNEYATLRQSFEIAQNELQQNLIDRDGLMVRYAALESQIGSLQGKNGQLETEKGEREAQVASLQFQYRQQVADYETKLVSAETEAAKIQRLLARETEYRDLIARLQRENSELNAKLQNAQDDFVAVQGELKTLRAQCLQNAADAARWEKAANVSRVSEEVMQKRLAEETDANQKLRETLQSETRSVSQQVTALRDELILTQKRIQDAEDAAKEAKFQRQQAQDWLDEERTSCAQLRNQLAVLKNAELSHQDKLHEDSLLHNKLNTRIQALETANERLSQSLSATEQELATVSAAHGACEPALQDIGSRIAELRENVTKIAAERDDLRLKLSAAQDRIKSQDDLWHAKHRLLKENYAQLQADVDALHAQKGVIADQQSQMASDKTTLETRFQVLSLTKASQDNVIVSASKELQNAQAQLETAQSRIAELRQENERVLSLTREVSDLKHQVNDRDVHLAAERAHVEELQGRVSQLQASVKTLSKQLEIERSQQRSNAQHSQQLRLQNAQLNAESQSSDQRLLDLSQELASVQGKCISLQAELERAREHIKESEEKASKEASKSGDQAFHITGLHSTIEELSNHNAALSETLDAARREQKIAHDTSAELRQRVSTLEANEKALNDKLARTEQDLTEAQARVTALEADNIRALESERGAKQELEEVQADLNTQESLLATKSKLLGDSQSQIHVLHRQAALYSETADKLNSARADLSRVTLLLKAEQERTTSLEDDLALTRDALHRSKEASTGLQTTIETMGEDHMRATDLEERVGVLQGEIRDLRTQLADQESRDAQESLKMAAQSAEYLKLRRMLGEEREASDRLNADKQAMEMQRDHQIARVAELNGESAELRRKVATLEGQASQAQDEVQRLKAQLEAQQVQAGMQRKFGEAHPMGFKVRPKDTSGGAASSPTSQQLPLTPSSAGQSPTKIITPQSGGGADADNLSEEFAETGFAGFHVAREKGSTVLSTESETPSDSTPKITSPLHGEVKARSSFSPQAQKQQTASPTQVPAHALSLVREKEVLLAMRANLSRNSGANVMEARRAIDMKVAAIQAKLDRLS